MNSKKSQCGLEGLLQQVQLGRIVSYMLGRSVPGFILERGSKNEVFCSPFLTYSSGAELILGQIFSLEYLWRRRAGSDTDRYFRERVLILFWGF